MAKETREVLVPDNMRVEKREVLPEPERNPSAPAGGPATSDSLGEKELRAGAKEYQNQLPHSDADLDAAMLAVAGYPLWVPENEALDANANPLSKMVSDRPWRAESEGSGTSENAPDSADKKAASSRK
jgi:hypothetical protein